MLTEIATTDAIDWAQAPGQVNARIAEIVARYEERNSDVSRIEAGPRPTKAIQRAVAAHRDALSYQLDMLEHLVREDREHLIGWNAADDMEAKARRRALEQNARMLEAIDAIRERLPSAGEPSEPAADEIGKWSEVLGGAFRNCNAELKKYVARDWNKRAPLAARIMAGCSIAGVVTLIGMPTLATVVGGVVIGGQTVADVARSWRGKGPE